MKGLGTAKRLALLLSVAGGFLAACNAMAAGEPILRPPMYRENAFRMPERLKGLEPTKAVMRMYDMIKEYQVGADITMMKALRDQANDGKVKKETVEKFLEEYNRKTAEIEARISKGGDAKTVYEDAMAILKDREKLFDSFLKDSKIQHHVRPGENTEAGDYGGMLVLAKGATGGDRTGGEVTHGDKTGSTGGGADAVAVRSKALRENWAGPKDGNGSGGLRSRLETALGNRLVAKAAGEKVNANIEKMLDKGNVAGAEKYFLKLKDVLDMVEKMGGRDRTAQRTYLTEILGEILQSRGVTAETFDEMEAFSKKGADMDSLMGLHRMSMIMRKLRAAYSEQNPFKGKEGTQEHDDWLAKRDEWVGQKMKDWVEFGEGFRASVAGEKGEDNFKKFADGTHDYYAREKKGEKVREDEALNRALCGAGTGVQCAGWMRRNCGGKG